MGTAPKKKNGAFFKGEWRPMLEESITPQLASNPDTAMGVLEAAVIAFIEKLEANSESRFDYSKQKIVPGNAVDHLGRQTRTRIAQHLRYALQDFQSSDNETRASGYYWINVFRGDWARLAGSPIFQSEEVDRYLHAFAMCWTTLVLGGAALALLLSAPITSISAATLLTIAGSAVAAFMVGGAIYSALRYGLVAAERNTAHEVLMDGLVPALKTYENTQKPGTGKGGVERYQETAGSESVSAYPGTDDLPDAPGQQTEATNRAGPGGG